MSDPDSPSSKSEPPSIPGTPLLQAQAEVARTFVEQSLTTQQRVVDEWASLLDGGSEDRSAEATPAREFAWLYDVWAETVENALVHVDDSATEDGVDIDSLRHIWLHALDDAVTDVGTSREFASTMARSVERTLDGKFQGDELRRMQVREAGLPTNRDVERLGERLLEFEYRQHELAAAVSRLAAAVGVAGPPSERGGSE